MKRLGYVGLSSPSYGTLTVFRQNALTYDGVLEYDPIGASYAFSPIGWQGLTCGGGNTENCRHTTSLKYRLTIGQARVAAIWQFGGYGQNNASNGAYQFGVGGDIPHLAGGVLSFDAMRIVEQFFREQQRRASQWERGADPPNSGFNDDHLNRDPFVGRRYFNDVVCLQFSVLPPPQVNPCQPMGEKA